MFILVSSQIKPVTSSINFNIFVNNVITSFFDFFLGYDCIIIAFNSESCNFMILYLQREPLRKELIYGDNCN